MANTEARCARHMMRNVYKKRQQQRYAKWLWNGAHLFQKQYQGIIRLYIVENAQSKRDRQIMCILHSDGTVWVHTRQLREKLFRRVGCLYSSKLVIFKLITFMSMSVASSAGAWGELNVFGSVHECTSVFHIHTQPVIIPRHNRSLAVTYIIKETQLFNCSWQFLVIY